MKLISDMFCKIYDNYDPLNKAETKENTPGGNPSNKFKVTTAKTCRTTKQAIKTTKLINLLFQVPLASSTKGEASVVSFLFRYI